MSDRILGKLGAGLVDPDTPLLRADDLGVLRGDAVFETVRLHDGALDSLDAHLDRLTSSAAALQLPTPDRSAWRALVEQVSEAWGGAGEAAVRLVFTRGVDDEPTGFVLAAPLPEPTLRQRRDGVRVVSLSRGVSSTSFTDAPWLLGGVKSTSYAVNMAALRYAHAHGADDAIFVGTDGLVLEAPTATVVWAIGETLCTSPDTIGILPGITVRTLFDNATEHGFRTAISKSTVEDLHTSNGVWLVSSVRGAVAVTSIDGKDAPDGELTERVQAASGL
ncbi:MAG TPA: aminotransferase class IV [Mycobacteriales bacterium]|nr:aminotransferase class IV [Mycobacteriales bacterium]